MYILKMLPTVVVVLYKLYSEIKKMTCIIKLKCTANCIQSGMELNSD